MLSITFLIVPSLFSFVLSLPGELQSVLRAPELECTSGIHMITVRATTEKQGHGALGQIVNETILRLPGSTSEAVIYPATGIPQIGDPRPKYAWSETWGIKNTTKAIQEYIQEYSQRCPKSHIALLGYSQGAQVIGDVLCGRSEKYFSKMAPISHNYTKNIRAILQVGDPSNVRGLPGHKDRPLPWHKGTSKNYGFFPRRNFDACEGFGDIWQSWCDHNDLFCDRGRSKDNIDIHKAYFEKYHNEMVDFILEKAKGLSNNGELSL